MLAQECYVCYEGATEMNPFVKTECLCRGTLKIHSLCFKRIGIDKCSICKSDVGEEALLLLTTIVREYDENGKLSIEASVLFDPNKEMEIYHGEYRHYFEDGRVWTWCNFNRGKLSKFLRVYNKNGELACETWYK